MKDKEKETAVIYAVTIPSSIRPPPIPLDLIPGGYRLMLNDGFGAWQHDVFLTPEEAWTSGEEISKSQGLDFSVAPQMLDIIDEEIDG